MAGAVGVAPSTTTIRLNDGSTIAFADWIDSFYYSTIQLSNAQTVSVEAFSAARSQVIPNGTRNSVKVDTNVTRPGSMGHSQDYEMFVYGLGIKFVRAMRAATLDGTLSDPVNLRTAFNIDRVTYVEYVYNGKTYAQGVPVDFPQGHGHSVFSTNTNFELANNGIPSPRDRVAMVLPIHERMGLGYSCVFSPENALAIAQAASDAGAALGFVDVKVYKYGLIKKPVV